VLGRFLLCCHLVLLGLAQLTSLLLHEQVHTELDGGTGRVYLAPKGTEGGIEAVLLLTTRLFTQAAHTK